MGVVPVHASRRRHGLVVAAGTAASNVLAYGLSVAVSRRLGPDGFGQVAPLLAVILVASVPGQALQAGIARRSARQSYVERGTDPEAATALVAAAVVGTAVVAVLLAAVPLQRSLLRLSGYAAPAWAAVSMLPQTLCFSCFGVLQGRERFGRLAWALVAVQGGRLLGGAAGLLVLTSASGALAGAAAGLLAAAAACCALAGVRPHRPPHGIGPALQGLVRGTSAVLSVLVLSNLDVVLARFRLSAVDAGTYAAGALVAKMAFFGPSFVTLLLFPRLARPGDRRRALRTGTLVLVMSTLFAVGGAALGRDAIPLLLGEAYRPLEPVVWLFAAAGSLLAAVYLLVQAGLALHSL